MLDLRDPPARAAWRHIEAREGFEVVFLAPRWRIDGSSAAVEDGVAWAVRYAVELDGGWRTQRAMVTGRAVDGERSVLVEADGSGRWSVDGEPDERLDGCLDVDLEASAFTNAFPVHRLGLAVGESADAPAAYVRAADLRVERLEQRYVRVDDDADGRRRYDYAAPAFDFSCRLVYDDSGLVVDYPGIAVRAV